VDGGQVFAILLWGINHCACCARADLNERPDGSARKIFRGAPFPKRLTDRFLLFILSRN